MLAPTCLHQSILMVPQYILAWVPLLEILEVGCQVLVTKWNQDNAINCPILLRKSMDWFLYDNGLHHERVNIFHKNSTEEPFHRKNVNNAMSDDGDFISKFLQQTVRKKEVQLTLHGLGH